MTRPGHGASPLEVVDGVVNLTGPTRQITEGRKKRKPVADQLRRQGRFAHLVDEDLVAAQEVVLSRIPERDRPRSWLMAHVRYTVKTEDELSVCPATVLHVTGCVPMPEPPWTKPSRSSSARRQWCGRCGP